MIKCSQFYDASLGADAKEFKNPTVPLASNAVRILSETTTWSTAVRFVGKRPLFTLHSSEPKPPVCSLLVVLPSLTEYTIRSSWVPVIAHTFDHRQEVHLGFGCNLSEHSYQLLLNTFRNKLMPDLDPSSKYYDQWMICFHRTLLLAKHPEEDVIRNRLLLQEGKEPLTDKGYTPSIMFEHAEWLFGHNQPEEARALWTELWNMPEHHGFATVQLYRHFPALREFYGRQLTKMANSKNVEAATQFTLRVLLEGDRAIDALSVELTKAYTLPDQLSVSIVPEDVAPAVRQTSSQLARKLVCKNSPVPLTSRRHG